MNSLEWIFNVLTFGQCGRERRRLDRIEGALQRIEGKADLIMASEADLQADLDKIAAGVTTANTAIADLKAQIAAIPAGPVTQAQLDALTAQADTIVAALNTPAAPTA